MIIEKAPDQDNNKDSKDNIESSEEEHSCDRCEFLEKHQQV